MANRRMLEKRRILLDSVRKLLALQNVSERDILENLKSVGVTEDEARELITEARGDRPSRADLPEGEAQEPAAPEPASKAAPERPARPREALALSKEAPKLPPMPAQDAARAQKVESLRNILAQQVTPKPSEGFKREGE